MIPPTPVTSAEALQMLDAAGIAHYHDPDDRRFVPLQYIIQLTMAPRLAGLTPELAALLAVNPTGLLDWAFYTAGYPAGGVTTSIPRDGKHESPLLFAIRNRRSATYTENRGADCSEVHNRYAPIFRWLLYHNAHLITPHSTTVDGAAAEAGEVDHLTPAKIRDLAGVACTYFSLRDDSAGEGRWTGDTRPDPADRDAMERHSSAEETARRAVEDLIDAAITATSDPRLLNAPNGTSLVLLALHENHPRAASQLIQAGATYDEGPTWIYSRRDSLAFTEALSWATYRVRQWEPLRVMFTGTVQHPSTNDVPPAQRCHLYMLGGDHDGAVAIRISIACYVGIAVSSTCLHRLHQAISYLSDELEQRDRRNLQIDRAFLALVTRLPEYDIDEDLPHGPLPASTNPPFTDREYMLNLHGKLTAQPCEIDVALDTMYRLIRHMDENQLDLPPGMG